MDGDGLDDLIVGRYNTEYLNDIGTFLLFINSDGTVRSHQEISQTTGLITAEMGPESGFGQHVQIIGDVNDDGVKDLLISAEYDDGAGGVGEAVVYVVFNSPDLGERDHCSTSFISYYHVSRLIYHVCHISHFSSRYLTISVISLPRSL